MNNTVCLCGSTRFIDDFNRANIELTKRGLSVITISMALPKNEQGSEEEVGLKKFLDLVHLNKILRADAIFVVGDGYIGESTAREILWAEMHGKSIVEQRRCHSWDNAAHCIRSSSWFSSIVPNAKRVLGLPLATWTDSLSKKVTLR
jgi:hypothetical protein